MCDASIRRVLNPPPCVGGGAAALRGCNRGNPDIEGGLPQPHGENGLQQEVRRLSGSRVGGHVTYTYRFFFFLDIYFLVSQHD